VSTVSDLSAGNSELETGLASFIAQNRLPGGAAGVICGDELAWSAGAGFGDLTTGTATDPAMLYGIASITKTFTGTALMQLRDAGRLDLDDPAVRWLGEIITRVSGIPYPRYIRDAILDPLGMTATGFLPLPAEMTARCATGYQWRALSDYLDPAPLMPPVWAEGGLWSCVGDLARWVSFQLSAYREPGATARVLNAESLREMHKPRYLADDQWTQAYGISWRGTRRDDTIWTGHAGGIPGFTSAICFNPAAQVGAVMLLNGRIGQQPDTPSRGKLSREPGHELRALDDHGDHAQLTCRDVVEHELQPEPAVGLEGIRGSHGSPGQLLIKRVTSGHPRLVIVGPQVDTVQRQVIRPGQMPRQDGLSCALPAADPQHRRPLLSRRHRRAHH
jgi:CubicO group peptidase (beta-lactamase class C family)